LLRLFNISIAEKVKFDENAIEQLVSISNGDLRKSITLMQSMACSAINNSISVEDVKEMSGKIPNKDVEEFIDVVKCLDQEKVFILFLNLIAVLLSYKERRGLSKFS
jgi:replication factor C subunit 2/4